MAYNSDKYVINLIEIDDTKKSNKVTAPDEIDVENWEGSS